MAESNTNRSVLLVEDDPDCQRIIQYLLAKVGVELHVAHNAEQGVGLLKRQQFDLVLMDVNLPGMSGIELTELIRSGERGTPHHTLIIAVTASDEDLIKERCMGSGMDGYLQKPFNREKLMGIVRRVVTPPNPGQ